MILKAPSLQGLHRGHYWKEKGQPWLNHSSVNAFMLSEIYYVYQVPVAQMTVKIQCQDFFSAFLMTRCRSGPVWAETRLRAHLCQQR